MATVTLTWEIEGIHDGISVYRSNNLNTGFELLATLAPNTVTFVDDFLLSQLTNKWGTEPDTLFYRLDAFRGLDVKEGDVIPVPLEDTMPEFLADTVYLDEIPEVSANGISYYTLGSHTINGNSYHVLAGVRSTTSPFITDVNDDLFPSITQYLRNLPLGATTLSEAIALTTEAREQHVLGANGDAKFASLVPFMDRTTPIMEVLPSAAILNELGTAVADLASALSLSGHFWTSTINGTDTNEFGQITEISATRMSVTGTTDAVSITGSDVAMTLTLVLIDDLD